MLEQFQFRIRGFHAGTASSISITPWKPAQRILDRASKSRPRHSYDNGLAEAKNGLVIRTHLGYAHTASPHAEAYDRFYASTSIPI